MLPIRRLNHAVLFVSDLERSIAFYRDIFGFRVIAREGQMAFLRAEKSENHHDLGLLEIGAKAPRPPRGSTGLYHLAWELSDIKELAVAREVLTKAKAFTGESDHERPSPSMALIPTAMSLSSWCCFRKRNGGVMNPPLPLCHWIGRKSSGESQRGYPKQVNVSVVDN